MMVEILESMKTLPGEALLDVLAMIGIIGVGLICCFYLSFRNFKI